MDERHLHIRRVGRPRARIRLTPLAAHPEYVRPWIPGGSPTRTDTEGGTATDEHARYETRGPAVGREDRRTSRYCCRRQFVTLIGARSEHVELVLKPSRLPNRITRPLGAVTGQFGDQIGGRRCRRRHTAARRNPSPTPCPSVSARRSGGVRGPSMVRGRTARRVPHT